MENTNDKEATLLARWLNGTISNEEKIQLENDPASEIYKKIADTSERLYIDRPNVNKQFEKLLKRKQQTVKEEKVPFKHWFYAAAAVVILTFGITFFINSQQESNITTAVAENRNIELPDGSTVILNAKSSITYDSVDFLKARMLTLDGEGYFKVKKGSSFTIQTDNGNVSVLGTAFNVYSREKDFRVFCDEGRVQVESGTTTIILNAGDGAFAKAEVPLSATPSNIKSPQWRTGRTYFQKEPIAEVYRALELHFPVNIHTKNIDGSRLYSGYFEHSDLENALKEISEPMRILYDINGSEVTLRPAE